MNEYIAAAVDELFELGVRHVVFSGDLARRVWPYHSWLTAATKHI